MFPDMLRREGTLDDFVIKEVKCYLPLRITADDIVLDIGANIGAFTRLAYEEGASRIIAIEPEPSNADMWRKNRCLMPEHDIEFFQAAVVPASQFVDGQSVHLFVNVEKNKGLHSLLEYRGRDTIEVSTISWEYLLAKQPTVVKVDIEGGEFLLDWSSLPRSIRTLAVEIHLMKKGNREKAQHIVDTILAQGFHEVVAQRDESGKRWTSFYIFQRSS